MKKITALLLAGLMLIALLVSCAQDPTPNPGEESTTASVENTVAPVTDATVDENGYELDSLPAKLDYGNETITMLIWDDYTMTEFFDVNETEDSISAAITARNAAVESRLGI